MADLVRWGILGTANIAASQFIPAIRASRRGVLEAVAARDVQRAEVYAREQGIRRVVPDYATLIADPDVDAVYIPLPNSLHAEWTVAAARAGKHVLCEKPLASDAPEAAAAVSECERAGIVHVESFVYRFHPQTLRIAAWLREGAIGEIRNAHAAFHFSLSGPRRTTDIRMSTELAGGALMDVGCYPISWLRFLFGEEPAAATAQGVFAPGGGVDTHVVGMLHFSGGRAGTFSCSFDSNTTLLTRIVGTAGEIVVAQPYHPRGQGATLTLQRAGRPAEEFHDAKDEPAFLAAVEHFHDCVLDGVKPLLTSRDAIGNMAAIDAVRRSALGGGATEPIRRP